MNQSWVETVNFAVFAISGVGMVVFNKQLSVVLIELHRAFWGRWFFDGPSARTILRAVVILVGLGWAFIGSVALKGQLFSN
jgi:hypothetical protein